MYNIGRRNKNFKTQMNKLQNEYGTDLQELNGMSEE